LVRRFTQLVGIYPVGSVVRLDTHDIGVVTNVHAPVPDRPEVRVVASGDGTPVPVPYEISLWSAGDEPSIVPSIIGLVDPADISLDPFTAL
jgi:hypothetical protein